MNENNDLYVKYHDKEWGVPVKADRKLFELLCLEGAQAGLSWETILKKRENYKKIFHNFDIQKCAGLKDTYLEKALLDPGIVRNRLKVFSVRENAKAALEIKKEFGSLKNYFWSYFPEGQLVNRPKSLKEIPVKTPLSDAISKDLKKRGFKFVGSTIIYAFLQAVGMIDEHMATCFKAKKR